MSLASFLRLYLHVFETKTLVYNVLSIIQLSRNNIIEPQMTREKACTLNTNLA